MTSVTHSSVLDVKHVLMCVLLDEGQSAQHLAGLSPVNGMEQILKLQIRLAGFSYDTSTELV